MTEFFSALVHEPSTRNALLAGLLASVACGLIGSMVVVRRMTYLAGGISHCVLGGIGFGLYVQSVVGWSRLNPLTQTYEPIRQETIALVSAIVFALLAANVIGLITLYAKERADTVISALWAVGMAVGLLFYQQISGDHAELEEYLFATSIRTTSGVDLFFLAVLDCVIVLTLAMCYRRFFALSVDEEFARARGIAVERYTLIFLSLTALTVVLLVMIVGVLLAIALLALPGAIAGRFTQTLSGMMGLATVLCMGFTTAGLLLSEAATLPIGPITVTLAGAVYLLVVVGDAFRVRGG